MPRVTVNSRIDNVMTRLERFGSNVDRAVLTDVSRTAYDLQSEAQRRAPVRTGWLRDHIGVTFENGGRTAVIGTRGDEVPYARFQKKFLQPAARTERPKLLDRLSERLAAETAGG